MTVSTDTSRADLVGDGASDTFIFTFEIYLKTDILVYVDEVLQTVDVNYTVPAAGIDNPAGGTVVFEVGSIPALAAVVTIILNIPFTQLIDYTEGDKFPAETHERGLDRAVKLIQSLRESLSRSLKFFAYSNYSELTVPDPVADQYLAWKDDLSGLKNVDIVSSGVLGVTDYMKTVLDDATVIEAIVSLGLEPYIKTQRSKFTYNGGATAYTVKVGAGMYFVKDKLARWVSELTTGAIGTPAATTRYYLYLDYSAITSGTPITASELIWSSTAPTYSHTYGGWYNGDDLCIFGVFTGAGPANILEFFHDGGDLVMWADQNMEANAITPSNTWTDIDMASSMPAFSTKGLINAIAAYSNANTSPSWRTNGQAGATGHLLLSINSVITTNATSGVEVITDAAQIIEVRFSLATTNSLFIYLDGWYFPAGM